MQHGCFPAFDTIYNAKHVNMLISQQNLLCTCCYVWEHYAALPPGFEGGVKLEHSKVRLSANEFRCYYGLMLKAKIGRQIIQINQC